MGPSQPDQRPAPSIHGKPTRLLMVSSFMYFHPVLTATLKISLSHILPRHPGELQTNEREQQPIHWSCGLMWQFLQKSHEKGHKSYTFSGFSQWDIHWCLCHKPIISYQSIKDEDVIFVTLRMFHHDVEEGIQSILEKLDKIMKGASRKSAM